MVALMRGVAALARGVLPDENGKPLYQEPDFFTVVDKSKQEWDTARTYFNNVTDPDLVDHAIYLLEAAEKKYIYLIKEARRNGVRVGDSLRPGQTEPPVTG